MKCVNRIELKCFDHTHKEREKMVTPWGDEYVNEFDCGDHFTKYIKLHTLNMYSFYLSIIPQYGWKMIDIIVEVIFFHIIKEDEHWSYWSDNEMIFFNNNIIPNPLLFVNYLWNGRGLKSIAWWRYIFGKVNFWQLSMY